MRNFDDDDMGTHLSWDDERREENDRYDRLAAQAELSFLRLNGTDTQKALEAGRNLLEYASSDDEEVEEAYHEVLNVPALRQAEKSPHDDIRRVAGQIIEATEGRYSDGQFKNGRPREYYSLERIMKMKRMAQELAGDFFETILIENDVKRTVRHELRQTISDEGEQRARRKGGRNPPKNSIE